MRKTDSLGSIDASIRCGECLWTLRWAGKFHKRTPVDTLSPGRGHCFSMRAGFIKCRNRKLDGITPILPYSLSVFNPLAEISQFKPWITDLSGITSMLLHSHPSSLRPRGAIIRLFFTMRMLNNASRCVREPVEMRTGFPAGSLNLSFPDLPPPSHALTHFILLCTLCRSVPGH